MKSCNLFFFIICTIIIIIIIIIYNIKLFNYDSFVSDDKPTTTMYVKNDGTKLYGSLFLDDLDEVIINMTNPPINYDSKRVELIKYSDILL